MDTQIISNFTVMDTFGAIGIAFIYIILNSFIVEPNRQKFNAIMIAGAGAAYLSGGFGVWEFVFCGVITFLAFKGLARYYFIGIGWLLHTVWDIGHHFYGNPIVPFAPTSSMGCAITDTLLAIWFFWGAPSVLDFFKTKVAPRHV